MLLNATAPYTVVVPVPADFWNVPALLITGVPPLKVMLWSFWTSKVVPVAMFNALVSIVMLPLPVHVAETLLLSVRDKPLRPAPLIDSGPLALVVPPPTIPPPLQLVAPVTVSVPVPVKVPFDSVKLVALDTLLVLTLRN